MNRSWKPKAWIAIILGVVLHSFTFLYLNRGKWWGIPTVICSFFAALFLFRSFLFEPIEMSSNSMNPTLKVGSNIWVSKLGYRTYGTAGITLLKENLSSPELMEKGKIYGVQLLKGDREGGTVSYVSRLIAVPGDSIAIKDGQVIVNGVSLPMSLEKENEQSKYYKQRLGSNAFYIQHMNEPVIPIGFTDMDLRLTPDNSYFFLGDNRDNSVDSRFWGFVLGDSIIGEVVYTF